jgi:vacuolar-type H+-ATPase subunit I/STV1
MAEQSLLSTLLSPTLAAQMASREEEERISQAGSPLLQEAARTAGMFTRQLGGLTGTDVRSPEVQKISQMQSVIQNSEGADIYEKMENALPELEKLDPAMAINLGKVVTERKAQARGVESRNALATYFAQQGYPVLAEAVAAGEMTPAKALEEMRMRRETTVKEQAEERKSKPKAVTAKQVTDALPFYQQVISRNDDLVKMLNDLADLDWTDYIPLIPDSILGFKIQDDPATVKSQIILVATERAEQLKLAQPEMSREEALAQALSELKQGSYASSSTDPYAGVPD